MSIAPRDARDAGFPTTIHDAVLAGCQPHRVKDKDFDKTLAFGPEQGDVAPR